MAAYALSPSGREFDSCIHVVLGEELNGAVVGPVDPALRAAQEPESQFEPDLCARIQREEVGREVAEVALAERTPNRA
jgi:hypothetical protein